MPREALKVGSRLCSVVACVLLLLVDRLAAIRNGNSEDRRKGEQRSQHTHTVGSGGSDPLARALFFFLFLKKKKKKEIRGIRKWVR